MEEKGKNLKRKNAEFEMKWQKLRVEEVGKEMGNLQRNLRRNNKFVKGLKKKKKFEVFRRKLKRIW